MLVSRKKIAMIMAEFLGTGILTMTFLAVSRSSLGLPFFVALAAGLVVVGMTLLLGNVSGAQMNPAITIGLWSARRVRTLPALVYIAAQFLGAAAAYLLFTYFVNQTWHNTSHFEARDLVTESVGAFVLGMGWAAASYNRLENSKAATVIGFAFALGILITSVTTLTMLNPAVALGTHNWVWRSTVLGPVLGAVIGVNLYGLLFAPVSALMADVDSAVAKAKTSRSSKKK